MPMPTTRKAVTCTHLACDRPEHAKGYCMMHYQRLRRMGAITPRSDRAAAVIENAEWLLNSGAHPADITRRLNYGFPSSLARALRRAGREDLATPFDQEASLQRRAGQC